MFPSICAYRATVVNSEALTGQQWLVIQTNLSDISGRTCLAYDINSCAKTHVTACNTFCRKASAKYFRITLFSANYFKVNSFMMFLCLEL